LRFTWSILVLIVLGGCLFANSFLLVTFQGDSSVVQNAARIEKYFQSLSMPVDRFTIATGGFFDPELFLLFAHVFDREQLPFHSILGAAGVDCLALTAAENQQIARPGEKSLLGNLPVIDSTPGVPSSHAHWYVQAVGNKRVGVLNLTTPSAGWYTNLPEGFSVNNADLWFVVMDTPDIRQVPQSWRFKSVVLPRKTAIYNVDLSVGLLLTELNIPGQASANTALEQMLQRFGDWKKTTFQLDPLGVSRFVQIPFFHFSGQLLARDHQSDLALFFHEPLPKTLTPAQAFDFFQSYSAGTLYLENTILRKWMERTGSTLSYDGFQVKVDNSFPFLSLWGEPYYLDVSREVGSRLIMKTFPEPQKITLVGPSAQIKRHFPSFQPSGIHPMYDFFWSLKAGSPSVLPSWRVVTQPYYTTYTVRSGDTLGEIARRLGVDVDTILAYNPDVIPMYLLPGTKLQVHIPYPWEKPQPGDSSSLENDKE